MQLDYSVYPDSPTLPQSLDTPEDRADYIARLCGAWDFGVVPFEDTFALLSTWRSVFDQYPLPHSPAYAAFRSYFGWPPLAGGSVLQAHYEGQEGQRDRSLQLFNQPLHDLNPMQPRQPQRPSALDPIAAAILEALQVSAAAPTLILGGHFALKCYLDYRQTHDIDAWWVQQTSLDQQQVALEQLRVIVQRVGDASGLTFTERSTRSMVSLELQQASQTCFSLQIAERTRELQPPIDSPWAPVKIETLVDNIGSKMNALVNRGAPRDFTDIRAVITADLFSVEEVWELWQLKNPDLEVRAAKLQVLTHLESIELRRPLNQISVAQRSEAQRVRNWLRQDLLGCPPVPNPTQDRER